MGLACANWFCDCSCNFIMIIKKIRAKPYVLSETHKGVTTGVLNAWESRNISGVINSAPRRIIYDVASSVHGALSAVEGRIAVYGVHAPATPIERTGDISGELRVKSCKWLDDYEHWCVDQRPAKTDHWLLAVRQVRRPTRKRSLWPHGRRQCNAVVMVPSRAGLTIVPVVPWEGPPPPGGGSAAIFYYARFDVWTTERSV